MACCRSMRRRRWRTSWPRLRRTRGSSFSSARRPRWPHPPILNICAKAVRDRCTPISSRRIIIIRATAAQADLCGAEPGLPDGLAYRPAFLDAGEEAGLAGRLAPLDFRQFEFDRLVAHYDALFGRENVFVFALEQFRKEPEKFLEDFCAKLEIERPPDVANERLNPSFRRGLLPVARAMNRFTRRSVIDKSAIAHIPYWYQARKKLLKWANRRSVFGRAPSAEQLLGQRTFRWIQQRFRDSNLALGRRMGVDLHGLGYFGEDRAEIKRPERARVLQHLKN